MDVHIIIALGRGWVYLKYLELERKSKKGTGDLRNRIEEVMEGELEVQ